MFKIYSCFGVFLGSAYESARKEVKVKSQKLHNAIRQCSQLLNFKYKTIMFTNEYA